MTDDDFSDEWESRIPNTCNEMCSEMVMTACGIEIDCTQCTTDFVAVDGLCGDLATSMTDEDFSDEWESRIPETCNEMCSEMVMQGCGISFRKFSSFFVLLAQCVKIGGGGGGETYLTLSNFAEITAEYHPQNAIFWSPL